MDIRINFVSCDHCGVVLDADKLCFPDIYDHDTGEIIEELAKWDSEHDRYRPILQCPVCDVDIFRRNSSNGY